MIFLGARSSYGQSTGLLSRSVSAITGKYESRRGIALQRNQQVARRLVTVPGDSHPAEVPA